MRGISRRAVSVFFVIKVLSGVAVWVVYTHYYTDRSSNDVFKFYDDALIMFNAIYEQPLYYIQMVLGINTDAEYLVPYYTKMANWYKPWPSASYHNNRIIIQFNAIVHLFSFGCYHVHTVFMSFLSLIGLTAIYKTFFPLMRDKAIMLSMVVYLIPSVLFWGSGLLKEGIVIFSLGLLIYFVNKMVVDEKLSIANVAIAMFSLLILCFTKMYVFAAIFPSLVLLIVLKRTNEHVFLKFLFTHILLFVIAVNLKWVNSDWDILESLRYKQWVITHIAQEENAGSIVQLSKLEPTVIGFVKVLPEAIVNTLLRPHIFEASSLIILMAGIENLGLLILTLIGLVFYQKPDKEVRNLYFLCLFFVLSLSAIIGTVNPVLGSIVRFRVPLLPFYSTFFIMMIDKERLLKRFPFLEIKPLKRLLTNKN